jgi:hypothetical protein
MYLEEIKFRIENFLRSQIPVEIVRCNPPLSCGPTCRLYFFRFERNSKSSSLSSLSSFGIISSLFSVN